jgi:predicted DNA-binding protein with PD1-like motif
MQSFRGATAVEVIAVRVDAGEELLHAVSQAVTEMQLAAGAIVSGSGTLAHMHLEVSANLMWPPAVYAFEKQGPADIISAQGHVVSGNAELYLTVARRNEVHAGRVMPGTKALHYVELVLLRAGNTRWARVPDAQTGIPLLQAVAPQAPAAVTLMGRPVDPGAIALVPPELLRKHGCLPVARTADTLIVAMADPNNPFAIDDLREATGLRIQAVHVPAKELMPALHQALSAR